MVPNELIFLLYTSCICAASLIALRLGKDTLIALICVQAVLANLFVTEEITLFGLTATASDALAVSCTLGLNLLQEYYQRAAAQRAIITSFFCSVFYTVCCLFQVSYTPSASDTAHLHFQALLTPMPRIMAASLATYFVVQMIDYRLYGSLRTKLGTRHFILRNYTCVAITQFIDTVLFSFLGLYKLNASFGSLHTIVEIIAISFILKLITLVVAAPLLSFSKKLRIHELFPV